MNTTEPLSPPVLLASGRLIIHTREPNGSQRAYPSTGPAEMTEAEWQEYCRKQTDRMEARGFRKVPALANHTQS